MPQKRLCIAKSEAEKPGNRIGKQSFGSFENWVSKSVN